MSSVSYNDDKGDQKIARVHFRCVKESELTCFNPQKVPAVCDYDLVELLPVAGSFTMARLLCNNSTQGGDHARTTTSSDYRLS